MQQVHLRINDAATGQPTPVRLRITDADGIYYAPHGRLTEFATGVNQDVGGNVMIGAKKWAYIDGACEILLPPGKLHIEIAKGPEYTPIDEEITLLAGKMALRFTIDRWSDVRKQGWYSGDTHVTDMMPHAALLEGQAEDLAVVNLLAQEFGAIYDSLGDVKPYISNILAFSGQQFLLHDKGTGVAVNTHNRHGFLGRLSLLHCHRVVFPLTFGNGWFAHDDWTLDDWCDQCHRKAGLVIWTKLGDDRRSPMGKEAIADVIRGKIDAFEVDFGWPYDLEEWNQLAAAGFCLPIVAGSGKSSNRQVVGSARVYAQLPPAAPLTYSAWIEAVRSGRTFVSNHPLVFLAINGQTQSTTAIDADEGAKIPVRAEAISWLPFDELKIIFNGQCMASSACGAGPPYRAVVEMEGAFEVSGHFSAVVSGQAELFAQTSMQLLRVAGRPRWADPAAVKNLQDHIEQMAQWAAEMARCRTVPDRLRHVRIYEEARTVLAKMPSS